MSGDKEKIYVSATIDKEKDAELYDFMKDKPRRWVVREALKYYMDAQSGIPTASPTSKALHYP